MTQQPSYILGGGNKTSIGRQIAHTVEALQKNASTRPIWDGVVEANQLAADCIKTLKCTNWVGNSQMSEDNLREFLEFLFFEFHIPEETRRFSLASNFKPESKVVDFVRIRGQNAGTPLHWVSSYAGSYQVIFFFFTMVGGSAMLSDKASC